MNGSRGALVGAAIVVALAAYAGAPAGADTPALKLRATPIGPGATAGALSIELFRWSTDAERAPLLAALAPLPPAPPEAAGPAGGRAGRGRGGRGAAPPPSPQARLTAAIKAAPSVGFIWGDGVTGYSIKYAWRADAGGGERIVLVTDRRLGAHAPIWPDVSGPAGAAPVVSDAEYTVIEMRLDASGAGEAKASLTTAVVVDTASKTLALDGYAAAQALLKVTR